MQEKISSSYGTGESQKLKQEIDTIFFEKGLKDDAKKEVIFKNNEDFMIATRSTIWYKIFKHATFLVTKFTQLLPVMNWILSS